MALPRSAVGWCAVWDFGISGSYSLAVLMLLNEEAVSNYVVYILSHMIGDLKLIK